MKKQIGYVAALAFVAVLGFGGYHYPVYADTATTTAPYPGGHRHALLAGTTDSINNKGAWVLENTGGIVGKISYVSATPTTFEEIRIKSLYDSFIAKLVALAR